MVAALDEGGYGLDAIWNDDFHHTARVAATGRQEAYYSDYTGSPQEFISSLKWGFLYQGQYYSWQTCRGKKWEKTKVRIFVPVPGVNTPSTVYYFQEFSFDFAFHRAI